MIRFSRSEEYAVILINALARNYNMRLVPLSEIAKEHDIPLLFLRNIAASLRKAHLLEAVEGKNGGYKLARDPRGITVGEILAVFTHQPLFSCCQNTSDGKCHGSCPHGYSLRQMNNEIAEKISHLNVQELGERL